MCRAFQPGQGRNEEQARETCCPRVVRPVRLLDTLCPIKEDLSPLLSPDQVPEEEAGNLQKTMQARGQRERLGLRQPAWDSQMTPLKPNQGKWYCAQVANQSISTWLWLLARGLDSSKLCSRQATQVTYAGTIQSCQKGL